MTNDTRTEVEARAKGEQGEPMSAKTISLLVTPEQALILHTASEISGAVRLVLRTIAFGNISSATVLITIGLRPKFPARFDHGLVRCDVLIFRGRIAGLPDRDVLDVV